MSDEARARAIAAHVALDNARHAVQDLLDIQLIENAKHGWLSCLRAMVWVAQAEVELEWCDPLEGDA